MKKYILKRDLPTFKAGETFVLLDSFETHGLYRESDGIMAYHQTTLYKFPNILMEWFEEIKPAEPLIKDEKIRKAVRAWAEALDLRWFRRCGSVNAYTSRLTGHNAEGVCYTMELKPKDLYGDKITKDSYTLAELCGEEEE